MSEQEAELQRKLNATHFAGVAAGFEEAAKLTRKRAGELFENGRDEEARALRSFATAFDARGVESRKTQHDNERTPTQRGDGGKGE